MILHADADVLLHVDKEILYYCRDRIYRHYILFYLIFINIFHQALILQPNTISTHLRPTSNLKLSRYLNCNLWIESSGRFIEGPSVQYVEKVSIGEDSVGKGVEKLFIFSTHLMLK